MAQLEFLGDSLIPVHVDSLEIIQQPPSLADHHQQPAARTMVFFVLLEMFGQVINPLREQRNLNVSRTGILLVQLKIAYRLCFCFHTY